MEELHCMSKYSWGCHTIWSKRTPGCWSLLERFHNLCQQVGRVAYGGLSIFVFLISLGYLLGFLPFCFSCLFAFLLLCFCAFLHLYSISFSAVMRLAALLPAPLLLCFHSYFLFAFLCFLLHSVLLLYPKYKARWNTWRHPKEILRRNPKWNPVRNLKETIKKPWRNPGDTLIETRKIPYSHLKWNPKWKPKTNM